MNWQPKFPFDAILFDCDGTLSQIEGIDYLAEINGAAEQVTQLTTEAMARTGLTAEIYQQRLSLVQPKEQQILQLGEIYLVNRVSEIYEVIQLLLQLKKEVYIVSAGIRPSLLQFGKLLNIPASHIFGVDVYFDQSGKYINYDELSPLIQNNGKRSIVEKIKQNKTLAYVGDGLNDCVVMDLVERFVGYGGSFYRKSIAEMCKYYINTPTMVPLLPLILTSKEYESLSSEHKELFQTGLNAISQNKVIIKDSA